MEQRRRWVPWLLGGEARHHGDVAVMSVGGAWCSNGEAWRGHGARVLGVMGTARGEAAAARGVLAAFPQEWRRSALGRGEDGGGAVWMESWLASVVVWRPSTLLTRGRERQWRWQRVERKQRSGGRGSFRCGRG